MQVKRKNVRTSLTAVPQLFTFDAIHATRPVLKDPRDDHVLELAVEAQREVIMTHNVRGFGGSERFGVRVMAPGEYLRGIGGTP